MKLTIMFVKRQLVSVGCAGFSEKVKEFLQNENGEIGKRKRT
jgi:hypothetical protein